MLKEIRPQKGKGEWIKLEIPRINLGIGTTGKRENDDARATAHHGSPVGCQELNFIDRGRLQSTENQN